MGTLAGASFEEFMSWLLRMDWTAGRTTIYIAIAR
jgi:hypothetical protein